MARPIYGAVYSLSLPVHPFDGEKLSGVSLPPSGLPGYDEGLLPPGDSHKGDMGAVYTFGLGGLILLFHLFDEFRSFVSLKFAGRGYGVYITPGKPV